MSLDILPRPTGPDVSKCSVRHSVFATRLFCELGKSFDLAYFLWTKALSHSATLHRSAFGNFICNVIGVRSQKHMVWIDTDSDIASVKNLHPVRDWTMLVFPRPTMGALNAPLKHQPAISALVEVTAPKDAARYWLWMGVKFKSLTERTLAGWHNAAILAHSLNRPRQAVAGQGRSRRVNAARPAYYAITAGALS